MTVELLPEDCLNGARRVLLQCIAVRETERVTIIETPLQSSGNSFLRANRILWWYRFCGRTSDQLSIIATRLIKQRENIALALKRVCEEIGCSLEFYGIDTCKLLNTDFKWVSDAAAHKVIRDLADSDVLIDLTLFGLDELPARRYRNFTNLRQELLSSGKIRGADIHIVSDRSFSNGAMCANYEEIEKDAAKLEGMIKNSRTLDIITGKGTDLRIQIDPKRVFKGTGMIHKTGEYHFLPSGIVSICLEQGAASGRLVLDGPAYAFGDFSAFPLALELDSDGRISKIDVSETAPFYDFVMKMFDFREARYVGELVLGLNPKGDIHSVEPMEFYVARGGVSLALGRNDHIGGSIPGSLHVHAAVQEPTIELDDRQLIVEKGRITKLGD